MENNSYDTVLANARKTYPIGVAVFSLMDKGRVLMARVNRVATGSGHVTIVYSQDILEGEISNTVLWVDHTNVVNQNYANLFARIHRRFVTERHQALELPEQKLLEDMFETQLRHAI